MYQSVNVKIKGVAPVMFHNPQLANPLNSFTQGIKKISAKRNKTEEDFKEMSRLEFLGGLYVDDKGKVIVPAEMLEASLLSGAKKKRRGAKFKAAVLVPESARLIYDGPKNIEKLGRDSQFVDIRNVTIQRNTIMRTRPVFKTWQAEFMIMFDSTLVNKNEVEEALNDAGQQCGIGDYRPRYGRFMVESFDVLGPANEAVTV